MERKIVGERGESECGSGGLVSLESGILGGFCKNILIFSFSLPPSAERQTPPSLKRGLQNKILMEKLAVEIGFLYLPIPQSFASQNPAPFTQGSLRATTWGVDPTKKKFFLK